MTILILHLKRNHVFFVSVDLDSHKLSLFNIEELLAKHLIFLFVQGQINETKLKQFGNSEGKTFLAGWADLNTSLEAPTNMTFHQLFNEIADDHDLKVLEEDIRSKGQDESWHRHQIKRTLFPRFGICLELVNHSYPNVDIQLDANLKSPVELFITDRSKRVYFGIDFQSQTGDAIKFNLKKPGFYAFKVTVKIFDKTKSDEKENCNQNKAYNYSKCVDDLVTQDLKSKFNCIPPWLSPNQPCPHAGLSENSAYVDYWVKYIDPYIFLVDTYAQSQCQKPCRYAFDHIWRASHLTLIFSKLHLIYENS